MPPASRAPRGVAALAVAIASLLCASGVVLTERVAGRDLGQLIADVLRPDTNRADSSVSGETASQRDGSSSEDASTGAPAASSVRPGGERPAAQPDRGGSGSQKKSSKKSPSRPSSTAPAARGGGSNVTPGTAARAGVSGTAPSTSATTGGPPAAKGGTTGPVAGGGTGGPESGTAGASNLQPIEQAVAELVPWVEAQAGQTFLRPLPVKVLSDADFSARLAELSSLPKGATAERLEGIWRALGLIGDGVDLPTELAKFTRAEVTTVYDAKNAQLLVRSVEPTPYVGSMLVRELTRALDDQRFDIYRPALDNVEEEARDGLKALVDGDAGRVQGLYVASLSESERAQVDSERQRIGRQIPADINRVVVLRFLYPIVSGPALVAALLEAGGRGRLDAAFAAPPTTSEQVLEPARYLAGEGPKPVTEPVPGGTLQSRGTLGQMGLLTMLSQAMDQDTAAKAAQGWGGDRYVSWRDGTRTCVRATIVTDSPQDDTELADALSMWAAARPGAEVSGSGPFTVQRCA
jgi:hypothetical protein